jgi:HEAT repeat protein
MFSCLYCIVRTARFQKFFKQDRTVTDKAFGMVSAKSDVELIEVFARDIASILASFSEKDPSGKQSLQQMLNSDPAAFCWGSVRALANAAPPAGHRYLVHLLRKHNMLMNALTDPRYCKTEEALAVAKSMAESGSPLDSELEAALGAALARNPSPVGTLRVLRILELLSAVSAQKGCLPFQSELMAYPDSGVRSEATLLLARSGRSTAFVGRLLVDPDMRVRANAVEALWSFDAAEARPLLLAAAKSKVNRVKANAAVGLHRIGEPTSVRMLFDMVQPANPGLRASALWAMGETGDPRFLPYLMELYEQSTGGERMAVLRALARIRKRERELAAAGPLDIRITEAAIQQNGARRLALALRSPRTHDLGSVKPMQFAVWEGGAMVDEFSVTAVPNPPLLIVGFILPRFGSATDPYRIGILEGINRAAQFRRSDDPWRIDRYLLETREDGAAVPTEKATIPYDDALLGSHKTLRGFLTAAELLDKVISSAGPRERAARDLGAAIERQSDALSMFSGARQIFLFLHERCAERLSGGMKLLVECVRGANVTVHGIAPEAATDYAPLRELCLAASGGTFTVSSLENLPSAVETIYLNLLNRYEVTYKAPCESSAGGKVLVSSELGCGSAEFSLVSL